MGNVVADGDNFSCPFCTGKVKLGVSSSSMQGGSKNLANTSNYSLSAPGAQCTVVPSAPSPCQPSVSLIDPGQSPLQIDGSAALGAGCKFMCAKGGLLTVSSSGQAAVQHGGASSAESVAAAVAGAASTQSRDEDEEKDSKKGNKDKSTTARERNKENQKRNGIPGNNQAQNKQAKAAKRKIEQKLGRKLNKSEERRFHDLISGENYTYDEMVDNGYWLFHE